MVKPDMSCARVQQYQSSDISSAERHNERKNESYDNINVEISRIPFNVHYKDTGGLSYMDTLRKLEADGKISLRGLRQDATLFDEIIIDVNTMYFEKNGGYEYAKRFYEEAYRFIEKKFGSEYVVSAVMHADELNRAASDDLNKPVYHYHLHAIDKRRIRNYAGKLTPEQMEKIDAALRVSLRLSEEDFLHTEMEAP